MRTLLLAALGLPLLAIAAPNADSRPPRTRLDEILVTATPLDDVVRPSALLDEHDLLLRLAPSLGETLEREPGISSSYFGPAASRPIIRGQSGSRVTVLTDAIATLDVSDVSSDHGVTVEPLLADRIEIVRGPATLLFGSAAAGGVVNVIDSRVPSALPDGPLTGRFEVRGDSAADEMAAVARLDGALGNLAWHLDAFDRDTDDIDIADFATADPAERSPDEPRGTLVNSASETDGGAVGLSWIGERGYLGVGVSALDSTYGLPGPAEEEGGEEEPALFPGPFLDLEQTRVDVRGQYRFDAVVESVKLAFGSNDYTHTEVEPSGEPGTVFDNEACQARVEALHRPLAGWKGALGAQYDDRDFSAVGEEAFVAPTTTNAVAAFVNEQRELSWGVVELGARVEQLEHETSADAPDYDETAISAALGLAWNLSDRWQLAANVSRTERHPAAEELYSNGPHIATRQFEVGLLSQPDVSVEEEVSTNVDLGLRRRIGRVQVSLSLFYNDIADYIYQQQNGDVQDGLPVALYAQGDAEFWGGEAELRLPLFEGSDLRTTARLFADVVRAELSDGGDLPRIPPWRAGLEVETAAGPWAFGADVVQHGDQDDITSFNTEAFTMLSAHVRYALDLTAADLELFVRGTNLLDEDARRSTSFIAAYAPLPGASVAAGIRARF